jgi:hypothetical protein
MTITQKREQRMRAARPTTKETLWALAAIAFGILLAGSNSGLIR